MARGRVLFLSGSVIGTASIVPYKHFSRLRHDRMILPCSFSRLFRHGSIQHSRYPLRQLFGGLGCCQLSVAAGSQYGGVQAVRHSGQSRAFKCGVKWEIHKSIMRLLASTTSGFTRPAAVTAARPVTESGKPQAVPMMEAPISSFSKKLTRIAASFGCWQLLLMARARYTLENPPLACPPKAISSPTKNPLAFFNALR